MDALFFWVFSGGMIGFALAVILNRNPVASALSFVGMIVFMSALFVMLSAFFLAVVQILVTAGAVMVLFLFIIMLLNVTAEEHLPRQKILMGGAAVLGLGFVYLFARALKTIPNGLLPISGAPPIGLHPHLKWFDRLPVNDDIHQIGHLLFGVYIAPFEVTSLLILVATIGVIVLCKEPSLSSRDRPEDKSPSPPVP